MRTVAALTGLGALALFAPSPASASDLHRFVRRNTINTDASGVFDPAFANEELDRLRGKFDRGNARYQENFRAFEARQAGETVRRRRRALEREDEDRADLARRYRKYEEESVKFPDGPWGGMIGGREGAPSEGRRVSFRGRRATKRQAMATVPLTSFYQNGQDSQYTGPGEIGTPGQTFQLNFDTGSADLWVFGPTAPTSHVKFNPSASSTFQNLNTAWSIAYGTGEASGTLAKDTVDVGGLTLAGQTFAVSSTTSSIFEQTLMEGIMGLAFSTIAKSDSPTFIENVIAANLVPSPDFGVFLQRAADLVSANDLSQGSVGGGELCLGCVDTSKFTGSLAYYPVTLRAYWEITMQAFAIDGQNVGGTGSAAAIDTGTSLIYMPSSAAQTFYMAISPSAREIDSQGHWAVPCSTSAFDLSIAFGGTQYAVSLEDFVIGYSDSSEEFCVGAVIAADQNDPNGQPVAIVGDTFLKNVYAVFSYANNGQVGFAPSTNSKSDTSTTTSASTTTIVSSSSTTTSTSSTTSTSTSSPSSSSTLSATSLTASLFSITIVPPAPLSTSSTASISFSTISSSAAPEVTVTPVTTITSTPTPSQAATAAPAAAGAASTERGPRWPTLLLSIVIVVIGAWAV